MLITVRSDPIDEVNHASHLDNSIWSAIGILVPGLHGDGQCVGTEGWIWAEFLLVTLQEYEELHSYTSFKYFAYFSAFYT